ncbi:hypothetical protein ASPWEDRAFT_175632 [Aspergillus wentii DTO 134E9]|uniref:Alpha/beta hydrolase fold-3 domain-containing protein n=1 Tax=Aspergillus wentii DTO 134E9 TaxID=1073089 RepID=A0A1L9RBQ2_ASPWE|nr:uncharacterized protein ASPWEDRAFT_175632 [Aspergillus wentii DTO 134E9]KAI9934911.1 hypothetical protein MW887_000532 [Aspergillus wentii]OJJ32351.1 hypothetical protein ASPWEDRAFT_175632 [Aspergillus wentii DTO 134E9]
MFSLLQYIYLKLRAILIRTILDFTLGRPKATPDEILQIPSRDPIRTIKAHIYHSSSSSPSSKTPILFNFHGSGFVLRHHGSDDEYCRYITKNTPYTVFDIQYRLAPEYPFPAAFHDVEDTVTWALSQPERFDLSRLALSGFSAGANLSLAVSSSSTALPRDAIATTMAFYSPTELAEDPAVKVAPDTSGKVIPAGVSRFFHQCLIPRGVDGRDPRISPLYADPGSFPRNVLIVTGSQDPFAIEAEAVAEKIRLANVQLKGERRVVCQRMEECPHAWDKHAIPGSVQERAKFDAYNLAVEMLKR